MEKKQNNLCIVIKLYWKIRSRANSFKILFGFVTKTYRFFFFDLLKRFPVNSHQKIFFQLYHLKLEWLELVRIRGSRCKNRRFRVFNCHVWISQRAFFSSYHIALINLLRWNFLSVQIFGDFLNVLKSKNVSDFQATPLWNGYTVYTLAAGLNYVSE